MLVPGPGTALASRPMSISWKKQMRLKYPNLKEEGQDLVFPVFINIQAESAAEKGGTSTSRVNYYNAAAMIEHIIWVLCEAKIEPGIKKPNYDWQALRIGTTEWYQDRQAPYMVVDLVHATNDNGVLGFMPKPSRLSVLHSHQMHALVIFEDKHCTIPLKVGNDAEDDRDAERRDQENRVVIKIFKWLETRGRRVHVSWVSLPRDSVPFDPIRRL